MALATKRTTRWSWRVATIDGIDVRLHVSLLLLVWLLLFVAVEEPGEGMRTAGFVTLLFVGVLLHEFAHCVVARHNGIGVVEIELLPSAVCPRWTTCRTTLHESWPSPSPAR